VSVKLISITAALSLCATAACAGTALDPAQAQKIEQYLSQLHRTPLPVPVVPGAPVATPGDETASVPNPHAVDSLLGLAQPSTVAPGLTYGMSTGQGAQPALPASADLDHDAASAIVAAFNHKQDAPREVFAADAAVDPALEERITLAETVFHVDGTEAIIRHFVETEHMKLIIQEVANHIDFQKLSDTDKYRLAAIAAVAQTELEDRIIRLDASLEANALSKDELMQLVVAFDSDAQRKLTAMRLGDDGKTDRSAQLDIGIAQYQIVKAFEAGE